LEHYFQVLLPTILSNCVKNEYHQDLQVTTVKEINATFDGLHCASATSGYYAP